LIRIIDETPNIYSIFKAVIESSFGLWPLWGGDCQTGRITVPCDRLAAARDELYGCASPKLNSPVFSTTSFVILLPTIFQIKIRT